MMPDMPHIQVEACERCGGLMVRSHFDSLEADRTGTPPVIWRCANCGNLLDAQILTNRKAPAKATDCFTLSK